MPLNFDANASLGLLPEVVEGLKSLDLHILNPSSIHQGGQRARALIESARDEVRKLFRLGRHERVVFTSGATEANNMALMLPFWRPILAAKRINGPTVVSTSIEHPSVLEVLARISTAGFERVLILPGPSGRITAAGVIEAVSGETILASVMGANNETGEVLPVSEIASRVKTKAPNCIVHSDCVQLVGKQPLNFPELGVDLLTFSGHKIGALTGVGALIVSERIACEPFILGGPQETRWRAGTENVLGIVSLGIAARIAQQQSGAVAAAMEKVRSRIKSALLEALPRVTFHAEDQPRLPNTLSVRIPGVRADDLVVALDLEGILVSSGAACASGKPEPSHVLLARGLSAAEARETIRISLCPNYNEAELGRAISTLVQVVISSSSEAQAA